MQIAGMFNWAARSAARRAPSSVSRSTPGMEDISPSAPGTSVTKIGQIRLAGVTSHSDTMARIAGVRRRRRRREAGKGAMIGVGMAGFLSGGARRLFLRQQPF